jgi:hypothetical protein
MANGKTVVGTLAEEVADLLRHDNLDSRIYEWMGLAFNDIVQRTPLSLFSKPEAVTLTSGTSQVDLVLLHGTPMMAVFLGATDGRIYLPTQLAPTDFRRLKASSGTVVDALVPLAWSLVSDGAAKSRILLFPGAGQNFYITLVSMTQYLESVPVGTDFLHLPYHFEHVLVWGAASVGAQTLRSQAANLYLAEYESALQEMQMLMAYSPDSSPALRSLGGVYAGTGRMKGTPRVPDTING